MDRRRRWSRRGSGDSIVHIHRGERDSPAGQVSWWRKVLSRRRVRDESGRPLPRWKRFFLLPYGNSLLTDGAWWWVNCARLAILVLACCEGIAWSNLGYQMGDGASAVVGAILFGSSVLLVVAVVDATFITTDFSRSFYERTLQPGCPQANESFSRAKALAAPLIRVVVVAGSMYITAPYLVQLLYVKDIPERTAAENALRVATARDSVLDAYDVHIGELEATRDSIRRLTIEEAAGRLSGRIGRGPVVRTIEARLEELEDELGGLILRRDSVNTHLKSLSPEAFANQYGVRLIGRGPRGQSEALQLVTQEPGYADAELAVRALLVFLFMMLLILKFWEPRSVRVYYNELLQDLFGQYRVGAFDSYLHPHEKARAGRGMSPLRFEEWCLITYSVVRREDVQKRNAGLIVSQCEAVTDHLDDILEEIEEKRLTLQTMIDQLEDEQGQVRVKEAELDDHISRITKSIRQKQAALDSVNTGILNGFESADAFALALSSKASIEEALSDFETELAGAMSERSAAQCQIAALQDRIARLASDLDEAQVEKAAAKEKRSWTRRRAIDRLEGGPHEEASETGQA